jgi:prepilin-type N-terminal cleavage/methylation domain-containing protein
MMTIVVIIYELGVNNVKRLKRKKGFTLIELLAVIIVLGIILVIAIPNIINLINDTKVAAYDRQKDLIVDATRKYVLQNAQNITWTDNTATIYLSDLQNYHLMDNPLRDPRGGTFNNTNKGTKVIVTRNGDQYTYEIIAVGGPHSTPPVISLIGLNPMTAFQGESYTDAGATAFDGTDGDISENITTTGSVNTATVGTYTLTYNVADSVGNNATAVTRTVNVVTYTDYATSESVNKPKLITGMTPIKWNNTEWVNTTEADADWYNYTTADKKWANAKTADGSMWVWIPRYAYQIATGYHTSTEGTINVKFLKEATNVASDNSIAYITPTYKNNSQTNYIAHPAFTFGNTELKGIWVAKFKASVSDIMNACYTNSNPTNCDKTTLFIRISPNIQSWRNINIGNMFTTIRNMEITDRYGWGSTGTGLDTHLMKNIELGAIAYLAQSTYGKNSEIWKNPANDFTTGCSADSASVQITTGCLRAYNTANGMNASTTGNIYGIYDMVGLY